MNEWYLNPGHWRYTAAYTGDKSGGINMNYASDANWGKKVAGHMFRFDSYLGKKEYNKYKLARVTNKVEVKKILVRQVRNCIAYRQIKLLR